MISKEEAEKKLLSAYHYFKLGGELGERIQKINISFKEIDNPKFRSHEWFVQETEITVRVRDVDLRSATYYLIGNMASNSIKNDQHILIKYPILRYIMISSHVFLFLLLMVLFNIFIGPLAVIITGIFALVSFPYIWSEKGKYDELYYEVIRESLEKSEIIEGESEMNLAFNTNKYVKKSDFRRYLNLIVVESFYVLFLVVLSISTL